jgi:hypothetical protein
MATRKDMKVPKNPLASWMILVASISTPTCARSDFDRMGHLHCNDLMIYA